MHPIDSGQFRSQFLGLASTNQSKAEYRYVIRLLLAFFPPPSSVCSPSRSLTRLFSLSAPLNPRPGCAPFQRFASQVPSTSPKHIDSIARAVHQDMGRLAPRRRHPVRISFMSSFNPPPSGSTNEAVLAPHILHSPKPRDIDADLIVEHPDFLYKGLLVGAAAGISLRFWIGPGPSVRASVSSPTGLFFRLRRWP